MKVLYFDIATKHKPHEFSDKNYFDFYAVFCFDTPFVYEKNKKLLEGKSGDIMIMQPGELVYHGPRLDSDVGFSNDWLFVKGSDFGELLKKYPLPLNKPFSVGSSRFLRKYLSVIKSEFSGGLPGSETLISCELATMVVEMHRAYHLGTPPLSARERMERARTEFLKEPQKQWTLFSMAEHCGYSESRFSSLYKQLFGKSPKQELIEARLTAARQMLEYTGYSVGEVAAECGFQSIYYFSKYFKKHLGCTPLYYRLYPKQAKEQIDERFKANDSNDEAQTKTAEAFEGLL